jgi:hypothetical protein
MLDTLRVEIDKKSEWASSVLKLQTGLNNSVQKTTGFTPIYLLTGHNDGNPDIRTLTDNFSATINKNTNLETNRQLAYDRIQRQATLAKQSFDKKRRSTKTINVGDFVFHPSGNSHLTKLDAKYEGPFEVLQLLPNDRFELKNLATNRKRIVANDMVRIWPGEFSGDLAE